MNRFARSSATTCRPAARAGSALVDGLRALGHAVVRLDARAEAALRARVRPLTARLSALLQRLAAANCGDAMARHLPHPALERGRGDGLFDDDRRRPRNTA
ncbi:hypothetical protein ACFVHB_37765 [Kitasatospora sp. NPDC127111]|uniref:hypothetical protein n=1 Tax=Kitasatospora sp. NPDC127111 TaxID=3345363 RepID=UPI0036317D5F